MVGPFSHFLTFCMLKKTIYVKTCFGIIWAKLELFYEILTLNIVLLRCFWRKFSQFSFLKIWHFLIIQVSKHDLFIYFFDLGNPVMRGVSCKMEYRERERERERESGRQLNSPLSHSFSLFSHYPSSPLPSLSLETDSSRWVVLNAAFWQRVWKRKESLYLHSHLPDTTLVGDAKQTFYTDMNSMENQP